MKKVGDTFNYLSEMIIIFTGAVVMIIRSLCNKRIRAVWFALMETQLFSRVGVSPMDQYGKIHMTFESKDRNPILYD